MNQITELLIKYGYWLVFASVVGRQACLPVPANLVLVAAGALAGLGMLNAAAIVAIAIAAFILADLAWFESGRKWGTKTLHFFCSASQDHDSCTERMVKSFRSRGPKLLLASKFVFGLDAVASPLSGICGMSRNQFVVFDGLGAMAWSSAYMVAGYAFHDQLNRIAADSAKAGEFLGLAVIAGIGCLVAMRLIRWYRFLHEFKLGQITAEALRDKLEAGHHILLLDLQGGEGLPIHPMAIPGSVRMDPRRLEWYIKQYRDKNLSTEREVILYGAGSRESTSARVALALQQRGFQKVRPLSGGLQAWRNRGYPVTGNPPELPATEHAVFVLREVLQHSRTKVASLLHRSAADVDRIFEEAKERIRRSHDPCLPMLKKEGLEKATNATTESAC